ncbi:MAG: EAL domain-containing protein [Thermodesulfobacteriota bacterium]
MSIKKRSDILRKKAEEILKERAFDFPEAEYNDLKKLVNELQIHQAELEIQNEELKSVQNKLEVSKDNYFRLFEFAPEGYLVINSSGIIETSNSTFSRIIDLNKDKVISKPFSNFILEEDKKVFYSRFNSFFKNPEGKIIEVRLKTSNSYVNVLIRGTRQNFDSFSSEEEGIKNLFLISVTDITAQREAEKKSELDRENFTTLIDKTPLGVCITDENGIFQYVNPSYCRLYGYEENELIGYHFTKVVPVSGRSILNSAHDSFIKNKEEVSGEWEVADKQGNILTVLADAAWIKGPGGSPRKATFVLDITKRKELENKLENLVSQRTLELENKQELLNKAQEISKLGSWEWLIDENRIIWSDEVYNILEVNSREFAPVYQSYIRFIHPEDKKYMESIVDEAVKLGKSFKAEHRIITSSGIIKHVFCEGRSEVKKDGSVSKVVGIIQDITEKKEYQEEIKRLSKAIDISTNLILITDVDGKIEYVNSKFEDVTGFTKDEAVGQTPRILSSGLTPKEIYEDLWSTVLTGNVWTGELMNRKKNGKTFWIRTYILPVKNNSGEVYQFMAIQEDITKEIESQKRTNFLKSHDSLTSLLNRKTFIKVAEKRIFRAEEACIILLDFDGLKAVNSIYGSLTGDAVLKSAAGIIFSYASQFKSHTCTSRFGEDEFAVYLEDFNSQQAYDFSEKIRKDIADKIFNEFGVQLTISSGIVVYPHDFDHFDYFISKLNLSLDQAKAFGKNRTHIYNEADEEIQNQENLYKRKEMILNALKKDLFEIWFQPILNLKTGEILHYEVLVRMRSEENNSVILPGAFIPAAETLGLINEIDLVVIRKTFEHQVKLNKRNIDYTFAINLSGKEIGDKRLLNTLGEYVREYEIDPEKIIFEITETSAITDLEKASSFIKELKDIGFRFSLDDFGVGFTSFIYLRELSVDYLKIDGIFVKKLHENKSDLGIIKAITSVARGFGIKTIAEFVEFPETIEILKSNDVDYAQGFYIGKPLPEMVQP